MDLEQKALSRLRMASEMSLQLYGLPLVVTDSGGKDSTVIRTLAARAGIPYELMHSHTTVDAPETVRFVRDTFRKVEAEGIKCSVMYPHYKGKRITMWELIVEKAIPPTRKMRYCCDVCKEQSGNQRFIVTGVRWAESATRKRKRAMLEVITKDPEKMLMLNEDNGEERRLFESCTLKGKRVCNPIIDWTDDDVWDYIHAEKITTNPLYMEGFCRVGCVGCPMAGRATREREFARWPTYRSAYIRAFDRMIDKRRDKGKMQGKMRWGETGKDVFHWWMDDGVLPGQMEISEWMEGGGDSYGV